MTPSLQIELGTVLSALHGISGDRERAMKELRLTADKTGVLWFPWVLRYWPHWESLRSHPEFELLVAEQEAKLAAVRQDITDEGMLLTPAEVLQLENFSFDPFLFE